MSKVEATEIWLTVEFLTPSSSILLSKKCCDFLTTSLLKISVFLRSITNFMEMLCYLLHEPGVSLVFLSKFRGFSRIGSHKPKESGS